MNFLFLFLLFLVFSFSQNPIPNQIEKSIFFYSENDNKVSLGLSLQNFGGQIDEYFTGNIWLSDNLAINSSLSKNSSNSDINLYYNNSITYVPLIFKSNDISANFNFGMHRIRFYKSKSYRWYDLSILSNFKYNNYKIILSWHYLTNIRNKHIINIFYKKLLYKKFNILIGSKFYTYNKKINFQPNLKLIINL